MPLLKQTMPRLALAFAAAVLFSAAARALPQTFVSSGGSDANTCERTAPCKTFAGALAKTDVRGEIVVLDAGEYGPVSMNKSVTITAEGVYAGIIATGGADAVTINAPKNTTIVLRGLTLTGRGGLYGVNYAAGGTLHVENCTISGFNLTGIKLEAAGNFFIKDTSVRNNTNDGISIRMFGNNVARASIDHCRLENNGSNGLYIDGSNTASVKVTVRDSIAAYNIGAGFNVSFPTTQLNVYDSVAFHNQGGSGFTAYGGAQVNAFNCTSTGHTYGFLAWHGGIMSIKDCSASSNSFGAVSKESGTRLSVDGCQLANNASTGLYVSDGGGAMISDSLVTGNRAGLKNDPAAPGTLETFGNNRVRKNLVSDVIGTITPVPQT